MTIYVPESRMSGKIERLSGPATHVSWTPDAVPRTKRELVSLVREADLRALESRLAAAEASIQAASPRISQAALGAALRAARGRK